MNTLQTLFFFFLALLLLVSVHEYGHFIVARCCGVKVLRFSIGFGKVLALLRDKKGTEFALSLIPLGGYVNMLNEENAPVAAAERHLAFNNQPVWARIAIVSAGPLFNFLFAWLAFWLVLVVGIKALAPMIDGVAPGSIAANAGLTAQQEILAINDKPIDSWRDLQYALMPLLGTNDSVSMTVRSMVDGKLTTLRLPLTHWQLDNKHPDVLDSFGIKPFVPALPPVVGSVVDGSPAQLAGFHVDDVVISVNGSPINDWLELLDIVKQRPGQRVAIVIKRQGHQHTLLVNIGSVQNKGRVTGQLGLLSKIPHFPKGWLRSHREAPIAAVGTALTQTVQMIGSTVVLMGRLATGKLSLRGVSGPVGIAQGAGESARGGFSYYVYFLALISISLGVLNLLPIPLLDGGHLLYYAIEMIWRRPLSNEFKSAGMTIGFVFLMALMVLALTNDLGRLVSKL